MTLNRNVPLLSLALCLMMSGGSLIIATSALVGNALATDKSLATLPLATQFIATMFTSIPAAMLMQRIGRKAAFLFSTVFGVLGASLASIAIIQGSFWLFVAATTSIGIFAGFSNYFRFAAAESVEPAMRSRAISWVMAGGVAAAVIGPTLARWTRESVEAAEFAGSYMAAIGLYLLIFLTLSFLKLEEPRSLGQAMQETGRPLKQIARQPAYMVAVICGMLGYGVMTFVMTATPLAMDHHQYLFDHTSLVIQWHVVAMFAPSFFTGTLIARFGLLKVMMAGAGFGFLCVAINLMGTSFDHFLYALVCLGISWNFLFVGSTTLLTETYRSEEKNKAQALNDFIVFTVVALASLSAGALQHAVGWERVNLGVLPLLVLVVASIAWLGWKEKQPRNA